MYDRGAGGPEGSLACPFLALADDRDARLDVPDRRHRCYADLEPAPRAIAHQQAYCLTAAFATCPTFQDWVRREGARVAAAADAAAAGAAVDSAAADSAAAVSAAGEVAAADEAALTAAVPTGPDSGPAYRADAPSAPGLWDGAPSWAAPPPWSRPAAARPPRAASEPDAGATGAGGAEEGEAWGETALRGRPLGEVRGTPGEPLPGTTRRPFDEPSRAVDAEASRREPRDRAAPGKPALDDEHATGRPGPDDEPRPRWRPGDEPAPPPAFLAARRDEAARRSAADRLRPAPGSGGVTGARAPDSSQPAPPPVDRPAVPRYGDGYPSRDLRPDGSPRPGRGPRAVGRDQGLPSTSEAGGEAARQQASATPAAARPPRPDPATVIPEARGAPPWERVRRHEAYPDLRVRVGLPRLPRLWISLIAVIVAAVILFFAPTLFPAFFGGQPTPSASPVASAAPSVSIAPTPPPAPTPIVYTVAQGDTLSGIARKFGLTLDELLAANRQIKNPNKLAIGDQLTIPTKSGAGASPGAAASGGAVPGSALP